jgi:hypothetical protein
MPESAMEAAMAVVISGAVMQALSAPRWVYGGIASASQYALIRGCPCCGNMGIGINAQNHKPCTPATCQLCGSAVCAEGNGPRCKVCRYGLIPGWSGTTGQVCGYAKCGEAAVARVPGKKLACMTHARRRVGTQVDAAIAHRDSGGGPERWTFTGPRVAW